MVFIALFRSIKHLTWISFIYFCLIFSVIPLIGLEDFIFLQEIGSSSILEFSNQLSLSIQEQFFENFVHCSQKADRPIISMLISLMQLH